MGFIYKATYRVSRKAYIGQTIQPIEKRLLQHQYPSSKCRAFLGAIKKYGWENFDVDWYECPDEDLNDLEEYLVAVLGTLAPGGYNLKEGGGAHGKPSVETREKMSEAHKGEKNHMYGKTLSKETKQKLSEAHTGKTLSKETKQKMSEALSGEKHPMFGKTLSKETKQKISEALSGEKSHMFGKTLSKETKQKISEALSGEKCYMYGKTLSKETKQKMSESTKGENNHFYGKTHAKETKEKISAAKTGAKNPRSKKVYRYELNGTFVDYFGSSGEAARHVMSSEENEGSVKASIGKCARGEREYVHGFKWSYTKL
ncbi:GIY-YIG catalytic domain-containing endonuclease [Paramecium bursaria Chlorella virus Can18-4]|nr:GIY-YIG catalytic domain-containing endonuclease [Paramecium bursaria Chlorella virus Can18-4]